MEERGGADRGRRQGEQTGAQREGLRDRDGLTEEGSLASYKPGDHARPSVAVDMALIDRDHRLWAGTAAGEAAVYGSGLSSAAGVFHIDPAAGRRKKVEGSHRDGMQGRTMTIKVM